MTHPSYKPSQSRGTSRREFLTTTGAAAMAGTLAGSGPKFVHAAGSDVLRLGLVGCGGRGTGAAVQALTADQGTRLAALGDAFMDRALACLESLKKTPVADRVLVDQEHCFDGFDAYKKVLDADVDVVLLATPTHFRPEHLEACVAAGKHVFAEKPVAVDAPGIRRVLAASDAAAEKNLSIVSGLCWRYETGMQETIGQIHDGKIGRIVALETSRYAQGVGKVPQSDAGWTEMQKQMRNWYYYTWLSGDFIVEQFVHELDKMAWLMGDQYPVKCYTTGGRQTRVEPEYGNIYDHFNAVFEYPDGVKLYAGTRHQRGTQSVRLDYAMGSDGACDMMKYSITGNSPWQWDGKRTNMHQLEHDAMYAALRAGRTINNGHYMANSTMMGILARMSAYTGKTLTWDQGMNSQQVLAPASYAWDAEPPSAEVAMPGVTEFS